MPSKCRASARCVGRVSGSRHRTGRPARGDRRGGRRFDRAHAASALIPIAYAPRFDRPHPAVILCAPRGPAPAREAMAMEQWRPNQEPTKQEQFILKQLETKRKLFGFLRRHRHELFDDGFQVARHGPAASRGCRWRCSSPPPWRASARAPEGGCRQGTASRCSPGAGADHLGDGRRGHRAGGRGRGGVTGPCRTPSASLSPQPCAKDSQAPDRPEQRPSSGGAGLVVSWSGRASPTSRRSGPGRCG